MTTSKLTPIAALALAFASSLFAVTMWTVLIPEEEPEPVDMEALRTQVIAQLRVEDLPAPLVQSIREDTAAVLFPAWQLKAETELFPSWVCNGHTYINRGNQFAVPSSVEGPGVYVQEYLCKEEVEDASPRS